jgi:hypothetical protein
VAGAGVLKEVAHLIVAAKLTETEKEKERERETRYILQRHAPSNLLSPTHPYLQKAHSALNSGKRPHDPVTPQ